MSALNDIKKEMATLSSPEKAKASRWFFKTGPGQYGEGDKFIGLSVPQQRKIAREFKEMPLDDVINLLKSEIHEHRLTALFILVLQYKAADKLNKKFIAAIYYKNRFYVNNWDLVDSSAPYILGDYLLDHSRAVLYRLAKSRSIWDRRIAVITTLNFIKMNEFDDTLRLAELLLGDKHDLIHKATGWCLREVGKKDDKVLKNFLDQHYLIMPRTMLRYAIERFDESTRKHYLGRA